MYIYNLVHYISFYQSYFQYYLYQIVKDTAPSPSDRIYYDQVENTLYGVQHNIISHKSFKIRPKLLGLRMFDEFTNRYAETEHVL